MSLISACGDILQKQSIIFKLISYLVRYNWAVVQGKVKPKDEYKGLAYEDAVIIQLDDVEEMTLTLCKEYNMQYEYIMDKMYYPDVTITICKVDE